MEEHKVANRYEGRMGKGARRMVKNAKRQEAEARNSKTLKSALDNSAAGNVEDLGDFTQYTSDN